MYKQANDAFQQQDLTGLSAKEIAESRRKHGANVIKDKESSGFWRVLKDVTTEPMFLLLLVAAGIYFLLGEYSDGLIMVAAIVFVSAISLYQETRSRNALRALKKLTQPSTKAIRGGALVEIPTDEVVVGDLIVVEEGNVIPADATILQSNDFSLNESILTGESFSVSKNREPGNNEIYSGTLATSGSATAEVTAVGLQTQLGKIGKSLEGIEKSRTPLQVQINSFVRNMAGFGVLAFVVVWAINYFESGGLLHGLLHGLTLAMSVLPEEIPVAFATFMALGAWKMARNGVLAKEPQTVESLGSATVICIDKTGTITENRMKLAGIYNFPEKKLASLEECASEACRRVVEYAMWSSEVNPFDPMETAIHEAYAKTAETDRRSLFRMIHEYPLSGAPPMMTHLYENEQRERIIAAKGGWEAVLACCSLSVSEKEEISRQARALSHQGHRVLAVASASFGGDDFPGSQKDFDWQFEGLIALEDPPKQNIHEVFRRFYKAGIKLKIITGDYRDTALSIARQTGFSGLERCLSGQEVMQMEAGALKEAVEPVNLFHRMFPEAKLRVVEALKANGEVVAMTGDGVNDAPALKSAHIGVAMGGKGTETAKRAASMVIIDDNLDKMADAIFLGRRIYSNFKKAVQYIISIHIPIILTVSIPLIFGWKFSNIFSPIHIIFFELIMGPTCSIIFENEPMEKRLYEEKPRKMTDSLFSFHELAISILQGLLITAGVLFLYKTTMDSGYSEPQVRTIAFAAILMSNIFLTLVNRSFYYSVFRTFRYANPLVPMILAITAAILAAALFLPEVRHFFGLQALPAALLWKCLAVSFISVFWVELYKWGKRLDREPKS